MRRSTQGLSAPSGAVGGGPKAHPGRGSAQERGGLSLNFWEEEEENGREEGSHREPLWQAGREGAGADPPCVRGVSSFPPAGPWATVWGGALRGCLPDLHRVSV